VEAHQVEPETGQFVFRQPEAQRIDHEGTEHRPLAGRIVARSGAAVETEVVTGNADVERMLPGGRGMVVYHVHDNADAVRNEFPYQRFQFPDTDRTVKRIRRIRTFGNRPVFGIVSPIVNSTHRPRAVSGIGNPALVDTGEIEDRHQLYMRHAETLYVVETGRDSVNRSSPFRRSGIGASECGIAIP